MFRAKLPAFLFLLSLLLAPASWATPTKILPLGDSITNGIYNGGNKLAYRDDLYDLLSNAGYDFEFVGTCPTSTVITNNGECDSAANPSIFNTQVLKHEGHAGFRTDWVDGSISTWVQSYDVDMALIHLGTNDILNYPALSLIDQDAITLNELESIIAKLKIKNSDMKILVAKIIPIHAIGPNDKATNFNQKLDDTWKNTNGVTYIVDQNNGFTALDLGALLVHPNQLGEKKMADKWFTDLVATQLLAPKLTFTPTITTSDGPIFTVIATSTALNSPVGSITYSTNSTNICAVDQNTGEVTPQAAGNCIIDAIQAAFTSYATAIAEPITVTITDNPQTVTFASTAPPTKNYGDIPFSVASSSTSTLPVTITSKTLTVCTIHPTTKVVTVLKTGPCILEATQAGNVVGTGATAKIFAAALPVTHNITINKAPQTISFGQSTPAAKNFGEPTFTISASTSAIDVLPVNLESTTVNVCTIDSSNKITIIAVGACKIRATQTGNDNYLPASPVTQTITINPAGLTIDFTAIEDKLFGSDPFELIATTEPSNTVIFSSSTTSICIVNGSTVTLKSVGICKLTATAGGGNTAPATAKREFEVLPNDEGNAKTSLIDIINNNSANDVTASQLVTLGLKRVNADLDYTQALKEGSYVDPTNPTDEELQKVIDSVNKDEIKTAGSISSLWLILLGFASLYRRKTMSLK